MFVPKTLLAVAALAAAPAALAQSAEIESFLASQPILGELECNNLTAYAIADLSFIEAQLIWKSTYGWTVLSNSSGILNEAKPVSGVFAAAKIDVTRASVVVDAEAQTIFDYLVTPEGYKLIDPGSVTEDFYKPPLEKYSTFFWRGIGKADKKRLEVSLTNLALPGFTPRQYVTLNAIDQTSRTFVSKSVQHRAAPGCSIYGPASCNALSKNPVRVLNTFAVRTTPVAGATNKSVVELINYADFIAPEFPPEVMNSITHPFLVEMATRMFAYFK